MVKKSDKQLIDKKINPQTPITHADIAEVERLIEAVNEHIEKMEKWIKEG